MGIWFQIQKSSIRKEVKHRIIKGIDREELVKLEFSLKEIRSELHWEHSKEFEFRGEMYDVVEKEYYADHVVYYCWWDNKETQLNQKLSQLLEDFLGKNQNRNQSKITFFQVLKSLYQEEIEINFIVHESNSKNYFIYRFYYQLFQTAPSTPPPQLVV